MQPIHFAHGYDWMALFFIGAPALIATLDFLLKFPNRWIGRLAVTLLVGFFLLDNAVWLVKKAFQNEYLVSLTKPQSATLHWLGANLKSGDMVICEDTLISYLVATYTPARSWQGHWANTPAIKERHDEVEQLFSQGNVLPQWKRRGVFYVSPAAWSPPAELSLQRRYGNSEFSVWASP
jgi:hypothetical protein